MGDVREVRVFFHAEEVVQVTVQFEARDYVNVTLAAIGNDPANFVVAETPRRIEQGVSLKLNAGFAVKIVLVALEASEKIKLALHLTFRGQRAVAHIHHGAAVGERWPVSDFHHGQDSLGALPLRNTAAGLEIAVRME